MEDIRQAPESVRVCHCTSYHPNTESPPWLRANIRFARKGNTVRTLNILHIDIEQMHYVDRALDDVVRRLLQTSDLDTMINEAQACCATIHI